MLAHQTNMPPKFLEQEPKSDPGPAHHAQHPQAAEEMQRPRQIAKQEANRDQIEENPDRAREPVVRRSPLAIDVADGNFANGSALPGRERGNEPVQLAVERNALQDFAAVSLE